MAVGGIDDTTMSDTNHGDHGAAAHATDPHGADAHGTGHGHDAHGHEESSLGPIDWTMWGVGVVGVLAALIVVAGFVAATNFAFNA